MSYYDMPADVYHELPAGTPGWQFAPVPGWGTNPLRAGPRRVGVGQIGAAFERGSIPDEDDNLPFYTPISAVPGDQYTETSWGMVALGVSGGMAFGVLCGYAWWAGPKR